MNRDNLQRTLEWFRDNGIGEIIEVMNTTGDNLLDREMAKDRLAAVDAKVRNIARAALTVEARRDG